MIKKKRGKKTYSKVVARNKRRETVNEDAYGNLERKERKQNKQNEKKKSRTPN